MLNRKRLRSEIARYLDTADALLPTNLVCVFEDGVAYDSKRRILKIPSEYGSVWIIDGQHRLYGFCHTKEEILSSFELICTGFDGKNPPMDEKSKQGEVFVDINQTAKRIPASLMLDLYDMIGRRDIRVEIVKTLSSNRLFESNVRFTTGEKGEIDFASFVQTPPMHDLVDFKAGILKRYYANLEYDPFKRRCIKGILLFFDAVRNSFRKQWTNPRRYDLATNKGIRTLLRLLVDIVTYENKAPEKIDFSKYLKALRGVELRTSELKGTYAGEGGADQLSDEWEKHIRQKVPGFIVKGRGVVEQQLFYPGQRKEAEQFIGKWLKELQGEVYGELAYVDPTTFQYLKSLVGGCTLVRIRVGEIKEEDKCVELADSLEKKGLKIEVKLVQQQAPGQQVPSSAIHERWLAGNNYEIDFGADLKSSALGGKKHSVQIFENQAFARSERYAELSRSWRQYGAKGKATTIRTIYPSDLGT